MARSVVTVPGDHLQKANPNVYQDPKHMHWAKKAEPKRHHVKEDRIPTRTDKVLQKTSKLNNIMNLKEFDQQFDQPKAGDILTLEFGDALAIETSIVEVKGTNILVYTDDVTGNFLNDLEEAEYRGRKVKLGKPMRGDVKKFKVYVRDPKTKNIKKVNFGDPNMRIKKSNPARRRSFRARHNCANPGPRTKARYWSCRKW